MVNNEQTLLGLIQRVTGRGNYVMYQFDNRTDEWLSWYQGKVKSFHHYRVWNGRKWNNCERLSLGMAKRVCEDWANLLINEKTLVTLKDEASNEALHKALRDCRFWFKANESIEKTFALGNGAWVVCVDGLTIADGVQQKDGKINVQFCNARKIRPLRVVDGVVTDCAFVSESADILDKTRKRYDVQVHVKNDNGEYDIYTFEAYGTKESALTLVDGKVNKFVTGSKVPWFTLIRPNIGNNVDIDSPFGCSIYANALDALKHIDIVYDSANNEFMLGRKRLFVKTAQLAVDMESGEQHEVFDDGDLCVYNLPEGGEDINKLIADSTQVLRVADHQAELQTALNVLSTACGLGVQHFRYDKGGVATATQIISENDDLWRNIRKHENLLRGAIVDVIKAVAYANNEFTSNEPIIADDITVLFDDSIIEDKGTERANDRQDVANGVMSKAEYRSKWFGEPIEVAQAKIDEIAEWEKEHTATFGGDTLGGLFGLGDEH